MQVKNKSMAIVITLILVTSMAISIESIPQPAKAVVINGINYDQATADAINAGMYWNGMTSNASASRLLLWTRFHDQIPTWTFGIASPNPVGIGQLFNLIMMNPQVPPSALLGNPIRYTFNVVVTKPDGTTEKLPTASETSTTNVHGGEGGIANGVFVSDSTGSTYTAYTPDQTGDYKFNVFFNKLQYLWNSTNGGGDANYYGTTFLASNYTLTVHVQQEPVAINGLPLLENTPTEYWARPIEGQNDQWYTVSSNWLCNSKDRDNGGGENRYQADGTAPNSPHILWTRPTEDNGIVGGTGTGRTDAGNAFNAGSQYQPRFNTQIIMFGRLYYSPNIIYSGTSELFDCVDLKTGELIYEVNTTKVTGSSRVPAFGYYYSDDNPNEHGIANPGWLFSSNYATGYQPERGIPYLNITGVPSGFEQMGPAGENLRFVLGGSNTAGYYLGQWNSSRAISSRSPSQTMVNASTIANYDWNVSLGYKFSTAPSIRAVHGTDYVWGTNGSWPTGTSGPSYAYPDQVTVWAISINPTSLGTLLYMKNLQIDDATTNQNIMFERASGDEQRFVAIEIPSCKFIIYDMTTGNQIATTDAQADFEAYGYFTWPSLISATQTKMAYGILYTGGYTGAVSAYSLADGSLLWRDSYPSGGAKIPNFVQMIAMIADGKIFVGTHEHSADTPLYKGEKVKALNATTGEEIWSMSGWGYPMTFAAADGVLIYWNNYDGQVYAIGKGPTATTVEAPKAAIDQGRSLIISGTVTDISAGTKQQQQAARFPSGVPAVSEASQSQWMDYVYQQKARPTNTTGVPVSIDVVDSNGNFRNIGTATSDANGAFSLQWKPDITGKYTVIATFAGSESYWQSRAETSFAVDPAAPTAAPTEVPPQSAADTYFVPAIAGLFVLVIVVAIVLALLMLRKHP